MLQFLGIFNNMMPIIIWLTVALLLSFVFLPFLSARKIIPQNKIGDWGFIFFIWPVSFPALVILYAVAAILGGIIVLISAISTKLFSWVERKFQ